MTATGDAGCDGLYLGLISGTSMDGVDAALVDIGDRRIDTIAADTFAYPEDLGRRLHAAIAPDYRASVHAIASMHVEVAQRFAAAARELLEQAGVEARDIVAIGSHGQTLRHHPHPPAPYSWQLGDGATLAAATGFTTVCDFRSLDVARGGEGAPLVPPFHHWCFGGDGVDRVILNIGGIANITVLEQGGAGATLGFDTGPGNCLMDEWCTEHRGEAFDRDGAWAAGGSVDEALLAALMNDDYFRAAPPKSTGREVFNAAYLTERLKALPALAPRDVQRTLLEFTVRSIADAIDDASPPGAAVAVCGGGAANGALMRRLAEKLRRREVTSTAALGVDPAFVEASAFAWLAHQRLGGAPVLAPTRASPVPQLLGAVHEPRLRDSAAPT
ncbi:MAG: anhydro-N-acetylmuramic acid kinase [Gammaproteobacteria bacterium]